MGKQSDGWEAANFRSSIDGQKGPRSSYADEVGKSPEKREDRSSGDGGEGWKKKEKAASKRPPSFILFQRALARFRIKRREHPLGPASARVFFFSRALFRPSLYPENPLSYVPHTNKRFRVRACTRRQKRRGDGKGQPDESRQWAGRCAPPFGNGLITVCLHN